MNCPLDKVNTGIPFELIVRETIDNKVFGTKVSPVMVKASS